MGKEINNQVAGLFSNFSVPGESSAPASDTTPTITDKNISSHPDIKKKKIKICSVISEDILAKAKALSKKEELQLCDILEAAVHNLIKEYEAENGELEVIQTPQKKKNLFH